MNFRRPTAIALLALVSSAALLPLVADTPAASGPASAPAPAASSSVKLLSSTRTYADWLPTPAERAPQRVVLNLTATPDTSVAVTWATQAETTAPFVEIAEAGPGTDHTKQARRVQACTEVLADEPAAPRYHHSAVLTGLRPGTRYSYRVGTTGAFGPWNDFTTAQASPAPFSFVWFGDPQDNIVEHCTRVFAEAFRTAPRAAFWLCTGDLCSDPADWQWAEFFEAAKLPLSTIPSAFTPGNHDTAYAEIKVRTDFTVSAYPKRNRDRVAPLWRPHFTLPENGPASLPALAETSYHLDYQGLRLIVLNSNTRMEEQLVWLESLLRDNPCRWTVLAFHHPVYAGIPKRDNPKLRTALQELGKRYPIDLVLTGHDHVYMRTVPLHGDRPAAAGEHATVYVTSVAGPKFYACETPQASLMARTATGLQLFQVIEVGADSLTLRAHSATGELVDSVTLRHSAAH